MKLPVRTKNAMLLGNGLIAHVRSVQDHLQLHRKLPRHPYLTYTQLVAQTGARLALVGIGHVLDEVMDAIHAPGTPDAMRGLTLFVTDAKGRIDYETPGEKWRGITALNAPLYRKAVLEQDWNGVSFVTSAGEG